MPEVTPRCLSPSLQHPAVADIAVVGIPDQQWGEGIAAVVVLKAGMQTEVSQLQDWVKERMRSSRVPQLVRFVEELPYNPTGKLLRREVKASLLIE